ncbi:uncharacterized protein B0J16DRAFT_117286 [Fusarium flagelliforme]|uniref:SnoaL-like domain-containing protein n=1 Tax=Fusarium flagelliforme TaxID=2675880 RepID=A0A395MST7_9HYPO|nr:uncharacterized protein B0J16DRAFT_117286 [Fusarium flagelliforme]KAH7189576.1 hypothetical protein B0J16DRAFT_117286 [Fusarium flagelliforme]RFN50229.1 hypothetical protein FIE12Z_5408 [Fusarium flagelliforme]
MSSLRSSIEQTAKAFFSAYVECGQQNDPALVSRDLDESCKRFYRPISLCEFLGVPPDQSLDNKSVEAGFANSLTQATFKTCEVENLTIDVEARRAAAMTKSDMLFKDGETIVMEHAWILDFSEDGGKVVRVVEFCDQLATRKMVGKVYPGRFGSDA